MTKLFKLVKTKFIKKFKKNIKEFYQNLDNYIKEPNDKNIHDIRVTIRRLEAIYQILPNKTRKIESLNNFLKMIKKFFKLNNELRDYDIISAKLEDKYGKDTSNLADSLKECKKKQIKNCITLALEISNLPCPKISNYKIKERKLKKRYHKILDRIELNLQKYSVIALMDEKKIDDLHMLRKNFKKLRYSLELSSNKESLSLLSNLKNIQDILGEIHDSDIIINYLKHLEQKQKLEHIIESEIAGRSKKYQTFVLSFKENKSKLGDLGL